MFGSAALRRGLSTGLKVGFGTAVAFGGTATYCVYAKEQKRYIIYAGPGMEEAALKLVRQDPGRHRYLPIKWEKHADGSSAVHVAGLTNNEVTNEDILFLASFNDTDSLLSQYTALYKLCDSVIGSMTIVAPYIPGTVAGEATPAARMLSNLPACGRPHRILSYDTNINISGVAKANVITTAHVVSDLVKTRRFDCLAYTSSDVQKRFSENLKERVATVRLDHRKEPGSARHLEVMEGSPSGKHVLLIDPVLHKADGPIEAARRLKKLGATSVSIYATHAVPVNQKEWQAVIDEPAIHKVYVTNSFRPAKAFVADQKFETIDLTPFILRDI